MSTHNRACPIDLREKPRCYMCGGPWRMLRRFDADEVIVRCQNCKLETHANYDDAVIHARGGIR